VTRFLVDTNVVLDIVTRDPRWFGWSSETLGRCVDQGEIGINPIVYGELAVGFERIEDLESALPESTWKRRTLPWAACFLAGRAFSAYRARGGKRTQPLPDFFIGAHAAVERLTLITRDASRFRTAFPRLDVVAPARR
jgi:predicted nucleic acid-binding protein